MIATEPHARVAGVDEAGRGPLAGPLYVAAVVLDPARPIDGLADSKQLTAARRDALEPLILQHALDWCVIVVSVEQIDELNIFHATMQGMASAIAGLRITPALALIDGNKLPPGLCCPARTIVGGDALEPAISAASILAKVARDRCMIDLDRLHPGYGFAQHKGYPTAEHLVALKRLGPTSWHRRSYAPVRAILQADLFGDH